MMRVLVVFWLFGIVVGLGLTGIWSAAVGQEARLQVSITAISDGDSLRAGKLRLRLHGIDAPEKKQLCSTASGESYACGQQAADWLRSQISPGQRLSCVLLDTDRYRRLIVQCFKEDMDLNQAVVRAGWALAYTRYSDAYIQAEQQAKAEGIGLWQGPFMRPEEWRRQKRELKK